MHARSAHATLNDFTAHFKHGELARQSFVVVFFSSEIYFDRKVQCMAQLQILDVPFFLLLFLLYIFGFESVWPNVSSRSHHSPAHTQSNNLTVTLFNQS